MDNSTTQNQQPTPDSANVATAENAENLKTKTSPYNAKLRSFYKLFLEKLPFLKEYKPLAIGVMFQLREVIWNDPQSAAIFNRSFLRRMMSVHTNRVEYLKAVIDGKMRYNLDGSEAHEISESEKEYSRERLMVVEKRIEEAIKRKELEKQEKEKEMAAKKAAFYKDKRSFNGKDNGNFANKKYSKKPEENVPTTIVKNKFSKAKVNYKSPEFLAKIKADEIQNSADSNVKKDVAITTENNSNVDNNSVGEVAPKKTLTLKGKLKLKPKKEDDDK